MKSAELFDRLADQLSNLAEAISTGEINDYAMPSVAEVREVWDGLNKELQNLDELKKADFVIKKGNEFYFVGMYLKSLTIMGVDRRTGVLAGISQAKNLGEDVGFVRNGYKELRKRLEA